ncbi:MAG: DNA methyltransferase [Patescibacteria group bacterium]|nr:methyltransferase domain-containing protein [Patescibacteria group bacterium]MBU0880400.1 methyltransferase domain-containing protein [Patescibacteria group bacterium]MBU1783075.1 methyltransferase domain-containing protein [Patescibacteria group bacterium]MBU2214414.1 methyltransferase domain-containing protein [Patescibacteria group bacterium]
MKYFFVLGNNPTLSIAEITSVFSGSPEIISNQLFILNSQENIQALEVIKRLGGTIKIGIINSQADKRDYRKILKNILLIIKKKEIIGKFKFGISCYDVKTIKEKGLGLDIKRSLQEEGINCRWVTSSEATLSSVVVEQNNLTSKGIEIILIETNNKILIGQTLAVQPFKELSFRDYGRPARDDLSGMIPPKLAQIMINLANINPDKTILDPFCGSGTILTEAMLMGYKNLIGSDISEKAINATKININWIKNNYQLSITNYKLFNTSAMQISKYVQPKSIDAIITEPYLGPQRGKIEIKQVLEELNNLYSKALIEFDKILKSDGCIVMIWPIFCLHQKQNHINPLLNNFKIINPLPLELFNNKKIKLTDRNTIIYGRPNQIVWREIVVLKKLSSKK